MLPTIAALGKTIAGALLAALRPETARIAALAEAEARKLAIALAEIARLLAAGEIDREEAAMLVRVQRQASEAVLAAFADIGLVAAARAVSAAVEAAHVRVPTLKLA